MPLVSKQLLDFFGRGLPATFLRRKRVQAGWVDRRGVFRPVEVSLLGEEVGGVPPLML